MKYYSLNRKASDVSYREAVIRGIAPDGGLYFPEHIPVLHEAFIKDIARHSTLEIGMQAMTPFVQQDIPQMELEGILKQVLDFDFPLVPISNGIDALELFHGPTMAFKDVGARFMALSLGYFYRNEDNEVTVLVATSGDTGGAVAKGFLGVPGVNVVILYPDGKVSDIQEKQLTTLGQNIRALRVQGTFDDCQRMVKKAFTDDRLKGSVQLTSANSINVARWLPQMLYYMLAYRQKEVSAGDLVFSVPSGNFGNICAGMVAQKMGLPISHFIAATNVNDTVPRFMETSEYQPHPSTATISNAMDVGDPSNFIRILELHNNDFEALKKNLSSYSFSDEETKEAMRKIYDESNYIADPHGAVGYLGLLKYRETYPDSQGIFLETAHPVKFLDVVTDTLNTTIPLPPQIKEVMDKKKVSHPISTYEELREFLLS
ncbi:MAG: threonine synthase [Flavobacteriaceae bacterium]|nr:threonine synthase [Muriicola sp.]MBT8312343.1 threonine synthase [Eudoraea sp.]NNJ38754.1 threonine synthase [Flavobacteriaceae bacterium]NNC62892.1 threonine synthase [Eudoraea sp.]NNK20593.1 threonine synthase [Flavobacteriaceae bacterium]